jgi:hypothetical protein
MRLTPSRSYLKKQRKVVLTGGENAINPMTRCPHSNSSGVLGVGGSLASCLCTALDSGASCFTYIFLLFQSIFETKTRHDEPIEAHISASRARVTRPRIRLTKIPIFSSFLMRHGVEE